MDWDLFKKDFLDRFLYREKRETKVVDFINFRQGGISVLEYFLKLTQLSKYASSLEFNPRDEMNFFVIGVSDYMQKECYSALLHNNIYISRLMVHAQQVEGKVLTEGVEMPRGKVLLMVVFQRVGLRYKTSLGLRKGFLIKFVPSSLRIGMIRCLTLSQKREWILVHQRKS